jgi:hypothetical protein
MKIAVIYTIVIHSMLLSSSFRLSQVHDDTSKLYVLALKEHMSRTEKTITAQSDRKELPLKPIFVINDCGVELPKELGGHKIQELGDSASIFIVDKGSLHAIKLNPVGVDRGNVVIILSDYIVTKDNKEARFAYGGGRKYVFAYNGQKQRYAIVRTEPISF